jgi:hypothetical protein
MHCLTIIYGRMLLRVRHLLITMAFDQVEDSENDDGITIKIPLIKNIPLDWIKMLDTCHSNHSTERMPLYHIKLPNTMSTLE